MFPNNKNRLLVVVYGLPGAGKTNIAELLSKRLNANYLAMDNIWSRLYSNPNFTKEESDAVFLEMVSQIRRSLISFDCRLIVEGVFASGIRFRELDELCSKLEVQFVKILVHANLSTLKKRTAARKNIISSEKLDWLATRFETRQTADFAINTSDLTWAEVVLEINQIAEKLNDWASRG